MYEELYVPLPNIEEYLKRIGAKRPEKANLESLNNLIYANQCSVPFENLDIIELKKRINLGTEALYDKIVVRKRGGYCFELNGLFLALLKVCGFDAYSCLCRIRRGRDFIPPSLHRGILVHLDGELWFCDVGYGGPMPGGALLVEDGFEATYYGQTFGITAADSYWWTIRYGSGKDVERIMEFTIMPQDAVEFLAPNEYSSRNETSIFCSTRVVNKRTPTGSVSIVGDLFTEIKDGNREEKKIQSPKELDQILKHHFGLALLQ